MKWPVVPVLWITFLGCTPSFLGESPADPVEHPAHKFKAHLSVRIDSGMVFLDISPPASGEARVIRFFSSPPPYDSATPAHTLISFYRDLLVSHDDYSVSENEDNAWSRKHFFDHLGITDSLGVWEEWVLLAHQEDLDWLNPESSSPHFGILEMRWRERRGPWYEVLIDYQSGTYAWIREDPSLLALTWEELFLQSGLVGRIESYTFDPAIPPRPLYNEDGELNPAPRRFSQPVYSQPDTTASIVVPKVGTGAGGREEDCFIALEAQGHWLRVRSAEAQDEYARWCEDTRPHFADGWILWTDGKRRWVWSEGWSLAQEFFYP